MFTSLQTYLKSNGCKKAHLVTKGFSQVEGLDFDKIISLVVQFKSVCTILVLAVLEKWKIKALMLNPPSYMEH